jgi:hypothetical protein
VQIRATDADGSHLEEKVSRTGFAGCFDVFNADVTWTIKTGSEHNVSPEYGTNIPNLGAGRKGEMDLHIEALSL